MPDPDARFQSHLFVCTNKRPDGHPRGCCAANGGEAVRDRLKKLVAASGLTDRVRVNACGCLDQCELGPAMVVYPEGVWYKRLTPEAIEEVFRSHVLGGVPVEAHRMRGVDFEAIRKVRQDR